MNTLAVGLSHRELLRLTIEQELEILDRARPATSEESYIERPPFVTRGAARFERAIPMNRGRLLSK